MSESTTIYNIETQLVDLETVLNKIEEILSNISLEGKHGNLKDSLKELRDDLNDQLQRIRKKEFEIAAVGREKAGKSSLLNAWIGYNLLPSNHERCTYTTTEIRSCADLREQKFSIEYFTKKEFDERFGENSKTRGSNLLVQKEKEEIDRCRNQIENYLDKRTITRNFERFEEVDDELKSAISEPGHARAVKKICIWTPKLSAEENVILHDVPGYDSPLTLHKDQTTEKIAQVDAILFAKQFRSPDLVDAEVEILEISDADNQFIKAKDKIVVALTNCDLVGSAQQYDEILRKCIKAWQLKEVPEDRIIPVCSIAELDDGSKERAKAVNDLYVLNGGKTGFRELKSAVDRCINDLKYQIAQDRCNLVKNKIFDLSKAVRNIVKEKYKIDENSALKDKIDEEEMDKIYSEWWTQKWKSIHENFQKYFYTHIRPNFSPDEPSYLNQDDLEFKNIYIKTINETFTNIEKNRKDRQDLTYNRVIHSSIISPKHGNIEMRIALAKEAIDCIGELTESLNNFLWKIIDKMIEWMRKEMWNLPEIREEVIGNDENLARSLVQHSFDALVKRLGRPATDIFLRFPRSKIERLKVLQEFQMELLVLDKFLVNGKLHNRGLYQFLANGKLGKFDYEIDQCEIYIKADIPEEKSAEQGETETPNQTEPKKRGLLSRSRNKDAAEQGQTKPMFLNANMVETRNIQKKTSQFEKLEFSDDATNFEQVKREIEDDLSEFLECMKNSVFYGSGIQRYFNQELENVRRKFINLEEEKGRWWHYVSKYLKKKDAKVVIPAPKMADEIKARGNMLKNIKEMKEIVEKYSA